jgi:hypothetical protein
MPYAILRTAKLKTHGNIGASLAHTFRTRETPNADKERTPDNEVLLGPKNGSEVHEAIRKRLPEKHRKDAVLGIEYFVGASPEWFSNGQDGRAYFDRAVDWIKERHGEANVVSAVIHRDETSPHAVIYVVPLDESGRLNAKKWTGGKAALSKMQSDFAQEVGRSVGLDRGVEGSLAKHTTIREFYSAVNKPAAPAVTIRAETAAPQLVKKGLLTSVYESPEQVAERLTKQVNEALEPVFKQSQLVEVERRKAAEWQSKTSSLQGQIKKLQWLAAAFEHDLTEQQIKALVKRAAEYRAENKQQRQSAKEQARIGRGRAT